VAFFDHVGRQLPACHVGTPADLAEAYLFAMTCTYLTRAVIDVDGSPLAS
jgi:hypothetical protein